MPVSGGVAGRQQIPVAAGLTDGLLLLGAGAPAADAATDGPLQNVKRWMQELQFPENVRPFAAHCPLHRRTEHFRIMSPNDSDTCSSPYGQAWPCLVSVAVRPADRGRWLHSARRVRRLFTGGAVTTAAVDVSSCFPYAGAHGQTVGGRRHDGGRRGGAIARGHRGGRHYDGRPGPQWQQRRAADAGAAAPRRDDRSAGTDGR